MSTDAVVGAASGAAKGFAVAGAPGAIIGGIAGAISGLFKSKSRKAARKADETRARMEDIQNAVLRRNQLREAYIARAQAVAAGAAEDGGLQSSTVIGAVGSLGSQFAYNERYFDTQQANINIFNKYSKNAAKFADYAGAAASLGSAALSVAERFPRTPNPVGKIPKNSTPITRSTGMGTLGSPVA